MTLHIETPLLRSTPLSRIVGAEVWLKMEALQPVGSFKIRGIGSACEHSVAAGAGRLICSSGGNAGYAVAHAGRLLDVPVEVIVPRTTLGWMRELIRGEGAAVTEHGASWDDAHEHALSLAADPEVAYIHPFDDPRIWAGHATMIRELADVLQRPELVIVAVGGGGLMIGVLEGMHAVGWLDVPVLTVETEGAASFARSVAAGRLVTLDAIDSIATSLGARTVAAEALAWTERHDIRPCTVTDAAAVAACVRFAGDHRVLVEPACGAALATVYESMEETRGVESILVIVCGGAGVNLEMLDRWRELAAT